MLFTPLKKNFGFTVHDIRRAHLKDADAVEKLVDQSTHKLFGDVNQAEIIDKCHKTLCLEHFDGQPIAFVAFTDHPNIPSIPPWEWSHWLYNIYHLDNITPRNSLWIHLAVWEKQYKYAFVYPVIKSIFVTSPFLDYILMVVPPGICKVDWLEDHGTRIVPSGFSEPQKVQTLYLLIRQHFIPSYKVRRAVVEDNDDLVSLIHIYSKRLQNNYGEYYVSEILTKHQRSGRQLIVAEYADKAVAVLFLNETVNLKLLNQNFELTPFYGLRKPHEDDVLTQLHYQTSETIMIEEQEEQEYFFLGNIEHAEFEGGREETEEEESEPVQEEEFESDSVGSPERKTSIKRSDSEQSSEETSSSDDVSFVNVSSAALILIDVKAKKGYSSSSESTSSSNYSAMILSSTDYEPRLIADSSLQRIHSTESHGSKHSKSHAMRPAGSSTLYGEPNAFSLEIAAAKPQHEMESLVMLLEAAFECFPNRDYCVTSLPSTCPAFKLLVQFTRVSPRPISMYPHELYVVHRNSVLGRTSVRVALKSDISEIKKLVANVVRTEKFIKSLESALNEEETFQSFVLLSETQIVGVAVLREEEDFEYLKSHYELIHLLDEDHHKAGAYGLLEHVVLSPIFRRHANYFLREIHRLSDYSVLYYCVFPSDTSTLHRQRSVCCVLSDFIAVRPRQTPEFNHSDLEECSPPEVVHRIGPPFALYVSTARHCNLLRFEINCKLVVVGSSDIALAFLESLICNFSSAYHAIFTNITVVSPHAPSYHWPDSKVRDMLFVTKNNYNYRYMNLICLRTYVNHVAGVMTGIKRKDKLLIINGNKFLVYDLLFLMCGKQFQKPMSSSKDKKKKVAEFPSNVFLVNTDTDAVHALSKLKKIILESNRRKKYKVVVYGYVLEAYCCVAALLEFGVPSANIIFVIPYPDMSENKTELHSYQFPDPEVDEAVHETIIAEGISMYQSYYFCEWIINRDLNCVTCVKFESRTRRLEVECVAMFMYNEKSVSARTFLAINKSGLVFDGGLVIGPDCKTNDPSIYAAGTITKYSRRYYADHMTHKYYNMEEIGWKLGHKIRKRLIPVYDEDPEEDVITSMPGNMVVPEYFKPLSNYCYLPGNLQYLSVTKPGKPVPLEVAMSSEDYGQVFVTGDCKQLDKQGYFRLHLNQHGVVETITCLSKFDIDRKNLISLWGKHEKLLNNLKVRFEMVTITDLFDYFREPWACAIYHDRFSLLEASIKQLLMSLSAMPGESPIEDLITMYRKNNWHQLSVDQQDEIEEKFVNSPYQTILQQKVLDYLRDNITFLPMYAHPMIARMLLQGSENSTMFQPHH